MDTGDTAGAPKPTPSGGKGKKKQKNKKMSLNEFLADSDGGSIPKSQNWAILSEDPDDEDAAPVRFDRSKLPTAPKAVTGPRVDISQIPHHGPFSAFVGNLSYDVQEADLENFFAKLDVDRVRIIMDNGRPRGYAYVDFRTRESFIEALSYDEREWLGRNIRVDLATVKEDSHGGFGGRDRDRGGFGSGGDPDRAEGDWRRRDPPSEPNGGSSFGSRDRYGDRDSGSSWGRGGDRDRDRGYGDRDRGYGGDRDRGYGDRDRGYGGDRDRGYGGDRRYDDRDRGYGGDRRYGGDRGFDRGYDRDRGYGGDRGFDRRDDRSGYGFNRDRDGGGRYGGRDDRYGGRGDDRLSGRDGSPADRPRERPVLKLQPRSKPKAEEGAAPGADSSNSKDTGARASSIFGAAKPVDTSAREREIEEKATRLQSKPKDSSANKENSQSRSASIFGAAKPVDTSTREREIEAKLRQKEGSGSKPRRDSEQSQEDRRESGGSGRDSEDHSRTSGDANSEDGVHSPPAATEPKMVPAPAPKENAWARKPAEGSTPLAARSDSSNNAKPATPSTPASQPPREESKSAQPPRPNAWADRSAGRGRGNPDRRNIPPRDPPKARAHKEKPLPKSYEEMPQLEDSKGKDFSNTNKFAFLVEDDENSDKEEEEEREEPKQEVEAS